ncbi:hypothetical protein CDL12_27233 [Handroanthus impetiginosus]|uniref:Protein TIFY n=1 Tax=Handroanthus impetiginosus TaxID=429701 RepID=A0A2G9G4M7_9LAMI|nr:hypothetical protein CDL12_27233 [Handroanthus impetiginosus]
MEIDFLGLNSPKFGKFQQEGPKDAFMDSEVETSLSLSTSSSLDSQRQMLSFCEKKKTTWEFPSDKMIPASSNASLVHYNQERAPNTEHNSAVFVPTPVYHASPAAGFLYNLNKRSTNLSNISELPAKPASLTMVYASCAAVFNDTLPQKADNPMYMSGSASTRLPNARIPTRGHTPTVAMARRATLARFLEKRLHRMNKARTAQLMGKSLNATNSVACNTNTTRSNMRRDSLLR